jgi:hypothetical protein
VICRMNLAQKGTLILKLVVNTQGDHLDLVEFLWIFRIKFSEFIDHM